MGVQWGFFGIISKHIGKIGRDLVERGPPRPSPPGYFAPTIRHHDFLKGAGIEKGHPLSYLPNFRSWSWKFKLYQNEMATSRKTEAERFRYEGFCVFRM